MYVKCSMCIVIYGWQCIYPICILESSEFDSDYTVVGDGENSISTHVLQK